MFEIKPLVWGDDNKTTVMDVQYQIFDNWLQSKEDFVEQKYTLVVSYLTPHYGWETDERIHNDKIEELKAKANAHWRSVIGEFLREVV